MGGDPPALLLKTPRLLLTMPGPESASRVVSYFEGNRDHLAPWEPPFPPGMFTDHFWERRLIQNLQEYRLGQSLRLALFDRSDPGAAILGLVNFTQIVRGASMTANLGYSLDSDAEGQGFMHEALQEALRHVFEELGLHRVQASYLPTNERSGRLLRNLDFTVEGYARDYLYVGGAWRDHILTSLTNAKAQAPEYVPNPRRSANRKSKAKLQ